MIYYYIKKSYSTAFLKENKYIFNLLHCSFRFTYYLPIVLSVTLKPILKHIYLYTHICI